METAFDTGFDNPVPQLPVEGQSIVDSGLVAAYSNLQEQAEQGLQQTEYGLQEPYRALRQQLNKGQAKVATALGKADAQLLSDLQLSQSNVGIALDGITGNPPDELVRRSPVGQEQVQSVVPAVTAPVSINLPQPPTISPPPISNTRLWAVYRTHESPCRCMMVAIEPQRQCPPTIGSDNVIWYLFSCSITLDKAERDLQRCKLFACPPTGRYQANIPGIEHEPTVPPSVGHITLPIGERFTLPSDTAISGVSQPSTQPPITSSCDRQGQQWASADFGTQFTKDSKADWSIWGEAIAFYEQHGGLPSGGSLYGWTNSAGNRCAGYCAGTGTGQSVLLGCSGVSTGGGTLPISPPPPPPPPNCPPCPVPVSSPPTSGCQQQRLCDPVDLEFTTLLAMRFGYGTDQFHPNSERWFDAYVSPAFKYKNLPDLSDALDKEIIDAMDRDGVTLG